MNEMIVFNEAEQQIKELSALLQIRIEVMEWDETSDGTYTSDDTGRLGLVKIIRDSLKEVNQTRTLTVAAGITSINGWLYIFAVVVGVGLYSACLLPYTGNTNQS